MPTYDTKFRGKYYGYEKRAKSSDALLSQKQLPTPNSIRKTNPDPRPNPNVKNNRVPTAAERLVLERLVATQRYISTFIDEQRKLLVESLSSLHSLEQTQRLELEGTQSAVIQTESVLAILGEHASICTKRVKELDALLNPIRTCPDDILRLIFEQTVQGSKSRLAQAKHLSHVCSLWRAIALTTPRIWSDIRINFSGQHNNSFARPIPQYWEPILKRAKNVPMALDIYLPIQMYSYLWSWDKTLLQKITSLERLTLRIQGDGHFGQIDTPDLQPPLVAIPELTIVAETITLSPNQRWDATSWMSHWPSVTSLTLSGLHSLNCTKPNEFPLLKHLKLQNIATIQLPILLIRFPNIRTLFMDAVTLSKSPSTTSTIAHKLERITAIKMVGPHWSDGIRCPQIQFISDDSNPSHPHLSDFISLHPTMTQLKISQVPLTLDTIAPQLEVLVAAHQTSFLHSWTSYGLATPPLGNLRVLVIDDTTEWMTIDVLEQFITVRCLPRGHLLSLLPDHVRVVEKLWITSRYKDIKLTRWGAYKLLVTAEVSKELGASGSVIHQFNWCT